MIETTSLPTSAGSLTQGEVSAFISEGFLGPKAILTPAQCALVMRYLRLDQQPTPPDWHKARGASESFIFDLASYPPLVVWLRQLLGPDIVLWGASIVESKPGQTHRWHTDIETSASNARAISVWIGLEHVSRRSALQVIRGSHRFGKPIQQVAHERGLRRDDLSEETALRLAYEHDASTAVVQADMADGHGLLFDGRIWHGSHNSDDTSVRTALLLQYAAADTAIYIPDFSQLEWPFRLRKRPRPPCVTVAGATVGEANRLVPPPPATTSGARLLTELHELPPALKEDRRRGWRPYPQFNGSTPIVSEMGCHVSVLSGGCSPHPPHIHLEEEVLLLLDGEAELIIPSGPGDQTPRVERLLPGSFVYYPAYQYHTLRNPGQTPITYVMFTWRAAPDEIRQPLSTRVVHLRRTGDHSSSQAFNVEGLLEGPTAFLGNLHAHVSELQPGAGYAPHADAHDVAIVVLSGRIENEAPPLASPKRRVFRRRRTTRHEEFGSGACPVPGFRIPRAAALGRSWRVCTRQFSEYAWTGTSASHCSALAPAPFVIGRTIDSLCFRSRIFAGSLWRSREQHPRARLLVPKDRTSSCRSGERKPARVLASARRQWWSARTRPARDARRDRPEAQVLR